jgi:hypothetical protein
MTEAKMKKTSNGLGFRFACNATRYQVFLLLGLLILMFAAKPCDASVITQNFSGYNASLVSVGVPPNPLNPDGSAVYNANPGGGVSVEGQIGHAQAFPGSNKSFLIAQSGRLTVGNQILAGAADAEANVHYTLMNKITGKVETNGEVEIAIKGSAGLGTPNIGPVFGVNPSADWAVYVGEEMFQPQLSLFYLDGALIGASLQHPNTRAAVAAGGATPLGQFSEFSDSFTPPQFSQSALSTTLSVLTLPDGIVDVDETADIQGVGYAIVDPVLTPVNPNDILVSDAPINPNPDAPLFTAAQIGQLSADGVDLSSLSSLGLIPGAAAPEPATFLLIFAGILGLLVVRKRFERR